MTTVFVAGATGYTGRSVVARFLECGIRTVAHVRPDSPDREAWQGHFADLGAHVDTAPWSADAMEDALRRWRPDFVFALLGTTARRARAEGASYLSVDHDLTVMLLGASAALDPAPCFVYLSSVGADRPRGSAYLGVRAQVEARIREAGVPHLLARPSFITGPDRTERRAVERIAARAVDMGTGWLAALGIRGLRERYASVTGPQLAHALVDLALRGRRGVVEAAALRNARSGVDDV